MLTTDRYSSAFTFYAYFSKWVCWQKTPLKQLIKAIHLESIFQIYKNQTGRLEMCSKCSIHPGGHNKNTVSDLDGAHSLTRVGTNQQAWSPQSYKIFFNSLFSQEKTFAKKLQQKVMVSELFLTQEYQIPINVVHT